MRCLFTAALVVCLTGNGKPSARLRLQQQLLRKFVRAPGALAILWRGAREAHGGMSRRQRQLFRASPRDVLLSRWCGALGLSRPYGWCSFFAARLPHPPIIGTRRIH